MTPRQLFPCAFIAAVAAFPWTARAGQIVICEVMYHPVDSKPEFIEVLNLSSNRYDIAKWKVTGGVELSLPDFNSGAPSAHMLKERERFIISSADPATTRAAYPSISPGMRVYGPWTGQLDNAGETITIEDAVVATVCELTYGDNGKWPVAADGAGHSLILINPDLPVDDWRNWRSSSLQGGSPGNPEIELPEEPIGNAEPDIRTTLAVTEFNGVPGAGNPAVPAPANPGDTKWKFYNAVDPPDAAWKMPGFDDSSWGPSDPNLGYAPLGADPTTSATFPGIRTPVGLSEIATYYYRTTFNWIGALTGNSFVVEGLCDDGAVFHLNGQEIGRVRLPAAPAVIAHTTTATGSASENFEASIVTGNTTSLDGKLVAGVNTLAIEVHNVLTTNNDSFIAPRLKITGTPSGLMINEVKPATVAGGGFIEFFNPTASPIDLNGYYLSDSPTNLTKFQIAQSIVIPPSGFGTIGFAESNLVMGESVAVYLTQPNGQLKQAGFSAAMPTDGRSAGRKPAGSSSWFVFQQPTPGAPNQSGGAVPFAGRLSESHFGATGNIDWVEFVNPTATASSGSGMFVASRTDFSDKVALPASLPGNGYASVAVDFVPDGDGEVVLYLIDSENNVIETAEITHRAGLDSVQKWPSGSFEWFNSATSTRDTANAPARHEEIVINEIMVAPPSSHGDGEFIELLNRSASAVSLTGWRLADGIEFDFPAGTTLGSGQFLVVAKNPAYMTANYPGLTNVHGPFDGSLRNSGELVRLEDERGNLADSVDYRIGGQWPERGGSSLELFHADMDNSLPSSWRASDESAKTTFETYTYTDTYRELRGNPTGNFSNSRELLVTLAADGHVILRNISLTRAGSSNLILTGDATAHNGSSAAGFLCTGTHHQSDTLADGFHLISTGTGDTKNNKTEVDCIGIARLDVLTLSFDARWVSGTNVLCMQTWDRSFGRIFKLPIPNNLGTPGTANNSAIPTPAPNADGMLHAPPVPTSSQSVVVSAKVSSLSGLASVDLVWRIDNINANGTWQTAPMNDSGLTGDAVAGDGTWSATVGPQADSAIIQFHVLATGTNGRTQECPRNGATGPGMWIVDNSPPSAASGTLTERYILSRYHRDALGPNGFTAKFDFDFPRMSNYEFNCTVITREKEIFYNAGMRKGGSPWTRDSGNTMARLRWKPPGDKRFRNRTKTWIDNDASGGARFHNRITRYHLYLLGYPVPDAEFVQNIVNESAPLLGDDAEPPDSDFFDRVYENGSSGELFEIDDAWYMYDGAAEARISADSVTGRWSLRDWNNTTPAYPSDESPIFFHGNFPIRFPEDRYDYGALSAFIKVAWNNNASTNTATAAWMATLDRMLDMDRTASYAAVRGYCADWDNFTRDRGKNGYFYRRPTDGIFEFHHWDTDLGWRSSDYGAPVTGSAGGIGWTNYAANPIFRRRLVTYLDELLKKYTRNSPRMNAWLDANNYQAGNTNVLAPFKIATIANPTYPTFFNNREATIINQINAGDPAGSQTYTRAFSISTVGGQSVATPLFSISGFAPSAVWTVDLLDHPEAIAAWTSKAGWTISGIALASGLNNLTVRALARDGTVITTLPFTVTFTGNGAPIAVLSTDRPSLNLSPGEPIVLDGSQSRDPEGGALTFAWLVAPPAGATVTHPSPDKLEARFAIPGIHSIGLRVTDPALNSTSVIRQVTVAAANDFQSFGEGGPLDPALTVENAELRDSYSPSTWYSVEDHTGRLLLQVLDDSAKPLGNPTFTHPLVTRDLPDSGDFTLQTDVVLDTRQFGSFFTGLWLEFTVGGQPARFAFGVDGGTMVNLYSATGGGAWALVGGIPHTTGTGAILRVHRTGTQLFFDRRANDVWTQVQPASLGAGALAVRGGVFLSTSAATTARSSFDYFLVADPANTNPVLANLRITEVMYNPVPSGVEYIELQNTGSQAIDLSGVSFVAGSPFAEFTFGSESLAPGEFIVVTENTAAFQAIYGAGIRLGGAWSSGNLSNGGEEVILLDPSDNEIHHFTYRDSSDLTWPAAADGTGPSLEVIDVDGDYDMGWNWRASDYPAGSPGIDGIGPDSDGDGASDSVEAAFGTSPSDGGSLPEATAYIAPNGHVTLTWPTASGRSYRVEKSLDLVAWQVMATVSGGTWEDPTTPPDAESYYRVSAVPVP